IDEMAEIVLSRYSISMQVKVSSLFFGEPNDQSMEKLITKIYNGDPYVPGSKLFDPNDQIYHFDKKGTASVFKELKTEYQNKISELNNMIGIKYMNLLRYCILNSYQLKNPIQYLIQKQTVTEPIQPKTLIFI